MKDSGVEAPPVATVINDNLREWWQRGQWQGNLAGKSDIDYPRTAIICARSTISGEAAGK
jgi:hypothetical protein